MCEKWHTISVMLHSRCIHLQRPNSQVCISFTPHGFCSILCDGFIFFPVETLIPTPLQVQPGLAIRIHCVFTVRFASILRRPWLSCLTELCFLSLIKGLLLMHSFSHECLAFSLQLLGHYKKEGFLVFHSSSEKQENKASLEAVLAFIPKGGDNFFTKVIFKKRHQVNSLD